MYNKGYMVAKIGNSFLEKQEEVVILWYEISVVMSYDAHIYNMKKWS